MAATTAVRPGGCKPAHRRVLSRADSFGYRRSLRPCAAWFSRARTGMPSRSRPLGFAAVRPLAVIGHLSLDIVGGAPPRIGGAPWYAGRALRALGHDAVI